MAMRSPREATVQVETLPSLRLGTPKLSYTISEFCLATGIGRTSVYEEISAGRLKAIKAAGRRLILHQDGEAWLQSCRSGT